MARTHAQHRRRAPPAPDTKTIPPPEPDRASRRLALITVIGLLIVLGVFGAILQLWVAPLLAYAHAPTLPTQEVHMTVFGDHYDPNTFSIEAGRPVRWTIDTTNADGCTRSIIAPDIDVAQVLSDNPTVIEFTPPHTGRIPFSCANASVQGYFDVH